MKEIFIPLPLFLKNKKNFYEIVIIIYHATISRMHKINFNKYS